MSLSERSHNVLNHKVWVICYAINSRLQFSEIDGRCRLYKSAEHRKAEDIDLATIIPVLPINLLESASFVILRFPRIRRLENS